jgi:hypothetical protein
MLRFEADPVVWLPAGKQIFSGALNQMLSMDGVALGSIFTLHVCKMLVPMYIPAALSVIKLDQSCSVATDSTGETVL